MGESQGEIDGGEVVDHEKQSKGLIKLQAIGLKILHNDKEPQAQKLMAEWMKKFDPTLFQTTLSVPANLKGMFEPTRFKVVKNGSAKKDKKGGIK